MNWLIKSVAKTSVEISRLSRHIVALHRMGEQRNPTYHLARISPWYRVSHCLSFIIHCMDHFSRLSQCFFSPVSDTLLGVFSILFIIKFVGNNFVYCWYVRKPNFLYELSFNKKFFLYWDYLIIFYEYISEFYDLKTLTKSLKFFILSFHDSFILTGDSYIHNKVTQLQLILYLSYDNLLCIPPYIYIFCNILIVYKSYFY